MQMSGDLSGRFLNRVYQHTGTIHPPAILLEASEKSQRYSGYCTRDSNGSEVSYPVGPFEPLQKAALEGNVDAVEAILVHMIKKRNWNVNERDGEGMTPLQWAAIRGHEVVLKKLLNFGADVHSLDYGNFTALHLSVISGKPEAVRILLDHGSNINAVNVDGDTPLHLAVWDGDFNVVETLLDKGAYTNISNSRGKYPLDVAVERGHLAITKLLKSVGAYELESTRLEKDHLRVNTSYTSDLFRWANDIDVHNIPEDAVVGGTDPLCNFMYIGRAWHGKHLLPAKVCPTKNRGFAYYTLDGTEYYTKEYQILCSKHVVWKPVSSNEDFNHGLLVGKGAEGEHFFVGRQFLEFEGNEYLVPGKIAVHQKILYVTFHYKVYEYTKFEILIIN